MGKKLRGCTFSSVFFVVCLLWSHCCNGLVALEAECPSFGPHIISKESRRVITSTDSGMITAVDAHDGHKRPFHLQFITLEPSSLFLPVLLHTDMIFYVRTGRGTVSWIGEDGTNHLEVERGDIYRLEQGSVFYVKSHPDPMREKLRIHAIFNTIVSDNPPERFVGTYSNIADLTEGFDGRVLQIGFGVSEEVIRAIKSVEKPPAIVPFVARNETEKPKWEERLFEVLVGGRRPFGRVNGKEKKKKTKTKTFNVFREEPDVQNCNGWSIAVTDRDLKALRDSDLGIFMVNLTKGSMMGPHWNPKATEIAIALHGQGMVQVVSPSNPSGGETTACKNSRFKLKEGDIFVVPRYHPMAQMSFNNDSFVFMGFTTRARDNHPQFLAGRRSVLQVIDREILAVAFNAPNSTIGQLLAAQEGSIMLECASCAEEAEKRMEEEEARKREEEEARKREEEEARKREEEEARRREKEEEARKRQEEEARKREEEEAKRREEEEEEARRREEEEARKREEEEEARRREETRIREEEEARRREEEEVRKREEEEARRREEEEARRREEEKARKREEEEARRKEEEEEAKRKEKEEQTEREREEAAAASKKREEREHEEEQTKEEEGGRREEEKPRNADTGVEMKEKEKGSDEANDLWRMSF